jgi:putative DNA methylase
MVWDFAETNPFGATVGDWSAQVSSIMAGLASLPVSELPSTVRRADARTTATQLDTPVVIVTDPPYFDQIGYADLSDFFYVWHRKALRKVHPDLYGTIVTPKDDELIATPYRHEGDKVAASRYFVDGFTETFRSLKTAASADHPVLIVYAHRQEESSSLGAASTGWDAMLEAILAAGLVIEGTLPIRGTGSSRQIAQGTNALAAYTVMVCRPRTAAGDPGTIADLRSALRRRLPVAVEALLDTGESMVDIRQAAIGPGMEVYSQFSSVYDGSEPIGVHRALTIINDELGRLLDEHLGEVDAETRWACQWYTDHHFDEGDYDEGRQLAQTYGLGMNGLADAGLVAQGASKVRLLARSDLRGDWTGEPTSARDRTPVWEACQHLVKRLTEGATAGEQPAARLLVTLGPKAGGVRELAQYLTNLAIEKGWSDDAIAYDALVKSWPRIEELAAGAGAGGTAGEPDSGRLFTA